MRAYHLDRTNSLGVMEIMNLQVFNDLGPKCLNKILDDKYPMGLSRHGNTYYATEANRQNLNDYLIETLFEYERLTNFPDKISKLQSFFATETIEECYAWVEKLAIQGEYNIWEAEIKHNKFIKLDASWFRCDLYNFSSLCISYLADKYWPGLISETPQMELLIQPPLKIIRSATF